MWMLCHRGRHGVKCGCCDTEVGVRLNVEVVQQR